VRFPVRCSTTQNSISGSESELAICNNPESILAHWASSGSDPADLFRDNQTHGRNLLILGASVVPKSI
jgi:hypothetical protein